MVASSASAATTGEDSTAKVPRYPLRFNSQSSLILHSPLRSPHRRRRITYQGSKKRSGVEILIINLS